MAHKRTHGGNILWWQGSYANSVRSFYYPRSFSETSEGIQKVHRESIRDRNLLQVTEANWDSIDTDGQLGPSGSTGNIINSAVVAPKGGQAGLDNLLAAAPKCTLSGDANADHILPFHLTTRFLGTPRPIVQDGYVQRRIYRGAYILHGETQEEIRDVISTTFRARDKIIMPLARHSDLVAPSPARLDKNKVQVEYSYVAYDELLADVIDTMVVVNREAGGDLHNAGVYATQAAALQAAQRVADVWTRCAEHPRFKQMSLTLYPLMRFDTPRSRSFSATPTEAEYARELARAYNEVLSFNPPFSQNILRSALELKDTNETLKGIRGFIQWCFNYGLTATVKSPLMSLETLAGAYLCARFGVEPTMADVQKFCNEISEGVYSSEALPRDGYEKGEIVRKQFRFRDARLDELLRTRIDSVDDISLGAKFSLQYRALEVQPGKFIPYFSIVLSGGGGLAVTTTYTGSIPSLVGRWPNIRSNAQYRQVGEVGADLKQIQTSIENLIESHRMRSLESSGCIFGRLERSVLTEAQQLRNRWTYRCPMIKTAWDLTPLSFLVDWFVDIGEFIERNERLIVHSQNVSAYSEFWKSAQEGYVWYVPQFEAVGRRYSPMAHDVEPSGSWSRCIELSLTTATQIQHLGWRHVWQLRQYERSPYVPSSAGYTTMRTDGSLDAYRLSVGMALIISFLKPARQLQKLWRRLGFTKRITQQRFSKFPNVWTPTKKLVGIKHYFEYKEFLRNAVRHGQLAGVRLKPHQLWNAFVRGKAPLQAEYLRVLNPGRGLGPQRGLQPYVAWTTGQVTRGRSKAWSHPVKGFKSHSRTTYTEEWTRPLRETRVSFSELSGHDRQKWFDQAKETLETTLFERIT